MIGRFALVAWPVEYGISAIQMFIVNRDGIVCEEDLGPETGNWRGMKYSTRMILGIVATGSAFRHRIRISGASLTAPASRSLVQWPPMRRRLFAMMIPASAVFLAASWSMQSSSAQSGSARSNRSRGGRQVYVVSHVDVPPNFTKDAIALLSQFAADSREDAGCVRFEVMQENPRTNHFTVVEVWRTRQAFEAHLGLAHSRAFREKLQPMLGSPFDERLNVLLR
jgi:quinol monooxygenase YgiN